MSSQNKKLVVCHILNELLPSGAETMLVNSAKLWNNCELHVVATAQNVGEYSVQFENAGYIVHHVYKDNFISQHSEFRKLLKKIKPDVVHVHRESQECYYELDAKICGVKKIVRTVHSCFNFKKLLRIRRILTRFIGRCCGTKYIAIGESVYQTEKNVLLNKPYQLIENWCDDNIFSFISENDKRVAKENAGISNDTFVIVSIGNCSDVKNHIFVLNALKSIKEKYKQANIKYIHLGSGVCEDDEKEYVKNEGLESVVDFVGRKSPLDYLKLADVFVMPSKYEGFGITALEAMKCGVPSLLTDVVGLRDFKTINSKNLIFSDLDENDFANKFFEIYRRFVGNDLCNDENLANAVSNRYGVEKSVNAYLKVYND